MLMPKDLVVLLVLNAADLKHSVHLLASSMEVEFDEN